jgi:hypothetical protein
MTGRRFPPPWTVIEHASPTMPARAVSRSPLVGTSMFGRHSGGEFPDVAISAKPPHPEGRRPSCYVPASTLRPSAVIVSQITLIARWEGPIRTVPGVDLACPLSRTRDNDPKWRLQIGS